MVLFLVPERRPPHQEGRQFHPFRRQEDRQYPQYQYRPERRQYRPERRRLFQAHRQEYRDRLGA